MAKKRRVKNNNNKKKTDNCGPRLISRKMSTHHILDLQTRYVGKDDAKHDGQSDDRDKAGDQ